MGNVVFPEAHIRMVPKGSGYFELAKHITAGSLLVQGYRILVIMIGRAEVLDRSMPVQASLQILLDAIARIDGAIVVVFTSPVPWPDDDVRITRKLFRTGAVLKAFCHQRENCVFSRAADILTTIMGINHLMLNPQGITDEAVAAISKIIKGNIQCLKLRQLYNKLASSRRQYRWW